MEQGSMFDKVIYYWRLLDTIGFFPMITLAGLAIYFVMRVFLESNKLHAIIAMLIVNFMGQLYYAFPSSFQTGVGTVFFTCLQTAAAIGVYSFLEAIKIIDIVKDKIPEKLKIKKEDTPNP